MSDETYSFSTAKSRLEEIVTQVRKKDTSLEKSLDLLEEGVRLANACTELIDHQDWVSTAAPDGEDAAPAGGEAAAQGAAPAETGEVAAAQGVGETEASAESDAVTVEAAGEAAAEAFADGDSEPAVDFFDVEDAWDDDSEGPAAGEAEDPSAPEG